MRPLLKRPWTIVAACIGLVWMLAGCDLADEDDLGELPGSWRATDLSVDGISVKEQLDTQYDRLVLTLRRGAEGGEFFTFIGREQETDDDLRRGAEGGEFFTFIGREQETDDDLIVQGTFDVDGDELTLFPDTTSPIEFDYAISDTADATLRLRAEEGASEDLILDLLRLPIRGAVDRVDLYLSKRPRPVSNPISR